MTLTELAREYRAEGEQLIGYRKHEARQQAHSMANWLDRCVANRTPNDHHAHYGTPTWLTCEWARRHGYQIAITAPGAGSIALILQRGDELLIANLPAHLHWDGHRISLATA